MIIKTFSRTIEAIKKIELSAESDSVSNAPENQTGKASSISKTSKWKKRFEKKYPASASFISQLIEAVAKTTI